MHFYKTQKPTIATFFILLLSMLNQLPGVEGWSYHSSNSKMTWTKAREWCQSHYTDMVAIQNHAEIEYLNEIFPWVAGYYWIGIRKIDNVWTWVGTKKHLTTEAENWAKGEPNNGRSDEDCVEIYIRRDEDSGKWNDESCMKEKTALCYTASCKNDSCSYHGECVETINNHSCNCLEGYYGDKCEHVVKCEAKEISAPEHGSVQCHHPNGDFSYNSECEYSCDEGYNLVGAKTTQCGGTKAWSNKPPTCELAQCFSLNEILHGTIQCNHPINSFSYQSSCEFSCEEGYKLTGSSYSLLMCNASGQWNDSQPTCEAVRCPTLEKPVDGEMICSGDSYGSSCTFSCNVGFRLQGMSELTCTKTAQWNQETPTCKVVECPALQTPQNGIVSCTDPTLSKGSICSFTCSEGFNLEGALSTECTEAGEWSTNIPSCTAVRCPTLEKPVDGEMICSGDSYGSSCTFSCNVGFRLQGTSELTCTKTAQWNQETPTCKVVECPALQTPQNGIVSCTDPTLSKGSICSFTCSEGFNLEGALSTECTEAGEWSTNIPSCTVVECPALQTPQNGIVSCTDPTLSKGSICNFTCSEGFNLEGALSTECTEAGEWSTNIPSCTAVRCPTLEKPVDGEMICSGDSYGSSCTFSCNVGFRLLGTSELTCTKTAQWNQETPTCKVVECPALQTPQNGIVSCTDPTLSKGSICSFTCSEGFNLEGVLSTECTEAGEWSTNIPSCTEVRCPDLQKPNNGFINCSSEPLFNTTCSFSCLDDYQVHGHEMVLCSLNGNWTGEVPECKAHPVSFSPSLVSGLTIGLGGTTAISCFAFVLWILKRLRNLKAKKFDLSDSDIDVPTQVYKSSTDNLIPLVPRLYRTSTGAMTRRSFPKHTMQCGRMDTGEKVVSLAEDDGSGSGLDTTHGVTGDDALSGMEDATVATLGDGVVEEYGTSVTQEALEYIMAGGLVLLVRLYAQTHLLLSLSLTSVFVMSWTYTYSRETMTWSDAKAWCENRSSWLMVIPNEKHNNYLKDNLPQQTTGYYWIGLRKTKNIWTWQGTAQVLEDGGSWAKNEPNNKKEDEDCVEMYINNGKQNGKWNDEKCTKLKHALCYDASCSETSCSRNGECVEEINNYTCKCNPGFTGHMCMDAVTCNSPVRPQKGNLTCIGPVGNFSFTSSCAVSCEEGYTLRGENTLTCLKTGNWSAETPSCEVIRCNALGSVRRGSMHCTDLLEKFAYGSVCQFECDVGFLLMGSNHTQCSSEGKWTHNPPVCQVVQCPRLPAQFGNVKMNCIYPLSNNSYNSTCVFNCDEGYKLIGSYKTQCDHTGQWTPNRPTCKAVTCDQIVTPTNSHMTCIDPLGNFSFRSSCAVSCEEGYTLRGENTLTCLKTGKWSADTPSCEVIRCNALGSLHRGSMHCTDLLEKFAYGSVCQFECDVGFLLMGSNHTQCSSEGKWTHNPPVCQVVQCPRLPAQFGNGKMNCIYPLSNNSYNSTCVFNCDEGYKLIGSYKTQCDHTGQWTPNRPTCKAVTCDQIVTPTNSHMTCIGPLGNFSFRSSCSVSCEEGYTLKGENTLTCLKTGKWSADTPSCEAVTCDQIVIPVNSQMTCIDPLGNFSFTSLCAVSCEEGYTLRGENTLTCLKTGKWSAETPSCEAVTCDQIVIPVNSQMTCIDPVGNFSYRSSCAVSCEEGYTLRGENTLTCLKTGKWSADTPSCEAVTCDQIVIPVNSQMTCIDPLGNFSFTSSCAVSCEEGYTLRGENTLTCLKTGKWSADTPSCEARQCPLLSSPEKGWMNCSYPPSPFSYGSHCSFGCEIGYMLRGESQLDCTSAGTWNQEKPSCQVVRCESLLPAPRSKSDTNPVPFINCSHPRGNFSFGSVCVFRCPEGYILNGTTDLICTSTGVWTDLLPTCIIQSMTLGTGLLVYGAIGAASALGLLLTMGVVMRLMRHFSKGKFTPDYSAWDGALNPVFEGNEPL
ncbi:uncharacterized protein LOC113647597 [Tachysurus fulvidraco]|uniref:uncharacterized protein LOC113647597 n=1 Tax=Tachysurus fulvidraco TaxID=1234273 RepID=UPI001FEEEA55|nr:uncharacterized protein LOC113647597 [Tachysurus fulvidraco]